MTEANESLVVDVDLKESDLQRANFWFRLRWSTRILLVFLPLMGLFLLTRVDLSTIFQNPIAATALIVLIVFPVLYPVLIWYQTKRGFGNLQGFQTKIQYSFSSDGYTVRDITCVPRPKHLPVEVWMPIASSKSIDYMASKNFKAMVTLNGEKILDDVVRAYRDACAKYGHGKQLGEDMIWGAGLYLADTPEEAKRRVEPSHDERYKWFAPFGFVRYADEQGRTWGTPGAPARTPSLADGIQQKAWFCGPPSHVIDGIKSVAAKYPGLEDFMIHWAEGLSAKEFKEQLRWFARDVMPAFQTR